VRSPVGGRAEERDLGAVRRLGLYGGSFDPVHAGHLHVARTAQSARALEHVVFVPAARPPHKPSRVLASGEERLAMLEIALRGEPAWSISSIELERSGPSYTVDTVRALPSRLRLHPQARIHLLLGSDNLDGLERWREVEALLELAEPVVVDRGDLEPALLERLARALSPATFARLEAGLLVAPPVRVSASELRARLARGEDPGDALPDGVLEYIRSRAIYGADHGTR
jgi:nicotinate-nucleotide adenylyltransferase